ncbi:MAG: 3-deoxy-7-phosphoheptulonate synthase [Smithellaceae bacterium]|nr:3-deoxy-7-phosphoheptulonate synthase [Smithellaceae bacterium]
MIVVMKKEATENQVHQAMHWVESVGFHAHTLRRPEQTVIGVTGNGQGRHHMEAAGVLDGVEKAMPIHKPYKLASREFKAEDTVIPLGELRIGGPGFIVMAGPCSVESEEQLLESAFIVKKGGGHILRGGAFKPRTSPYSFQGMEEEGLKLLAKAREKSQLPVITEVVNPEDVELVAGYADILQIGARNVQNFALLRKVGKIDKPVLLKRGMMTTLEELLLAAEYILSGGNEKVILCERGIRTFETATRSTLDISAIPVLKELTHLPVIVDPSHASGNWKYIIPLCRAALAVGADGILVEVHPDPQLASCDGNQSLRPDRFYQLMEELREMKPIHKGATGNSL